MRVSVGKVSLAMLAALTLSGCGSHDTPAAAPTTTAPHEITPALDLGLCGSADAAQVGTLSGLGTVALISSDALMCRWETPDGSNVVFRWFRNSPLDEYRTEATAAAARASIDIVGRSGYSWRATHSCEVAVRTGDTDFLTWTVDSAATVGEADCAAADRLASMTLAKR